MIFRRSLVREMTVTAVGLFLVLLGILFTNLVLRLLALAAGGTVAPDGLLALLGFNALFYFNILVSVTVFVTVLLTLVRWYRDSEMIVWFSSGIGLADCLRPILWFATPFFVAILVLSLFLSPLGDAAQTRIRAAARVARRNRADYARACSGNSGAPIWWFSSRASTRFDGTIRNVFLQSVEDGKDATTVARSGSLQVAANGDRFIVLDDGRRYEGKPGTTEYRIVEFGRLGRRIEPAELRALPSSTKAIPTATLLALDGPLERAELFWRLSIPIASIVLTLLAVPLAYVNPRIGTSFNIIAAVFLYMLYSNCLNIVQSFIAQGKLGFLPGSSFRTRSRSASCSFSTGISCRCSDSSAAGNGRRRPPDEDAHALHRPRGAHRDPADLQRARGAVRVLRPDPRARQRGARRLHDHDGAALRRAAASVAHVRALSRVDADRHAVRAGAARGELRIHRDARIRRLAAAGRMVADAHRHPAVDRDVSRRRVRRAAGRPPVAAGPRAGDGRHVARRRPAVQVGILVQAGPDVRQHPQRAERPLDRRHQHLRVRPRFPAAQRADGGIGNLHRQRPLAPQVRAQHGHRVDRHHRDRRRHLPCGTPCCVRRC